MKPKKLLPLLLALVLALQLAAPAAAAETGERPPVQEPGTVLVTDSAPSSDAGQEETIGDMTEGETGENGADGTETGDAGTGENETAGTDLSGTGTDPDNDTQVPPLPPAPGEEEGPGTTGTEGDGTEPGGEQDPRPGEGEAPQPDEGEQDPQPSEEQAPQPGEGEDPIPPADDPESEVPPAPGEGDDPSADTPSADTPSGEVPEAPPEEVPLEEVPVEEVPVEEVPVVTLPMETAQPPAMLGAAPASAEDVANLAIVNVTVQDPLPIQINPYNMAIDVPWEADEDGNIIDCRSTSASVAGAPCRIVNNGNTPVEVRATASATTTNGVLLARQSTREEPYPEERSVFLFMELQAFDRESDIDGFNWMDNRDYIRDPGNAVLIEESGSETATVEMPEGGCAAFHIAGDSSYPHYFGEWEEDDDVQVTVFLSFTAIAYYHVNFEVDFYWPTGGPDCSPTVVSANGVTIGSNGIDVLAGEDLWFHVDTSNIDPDDTDMIYEFNQVVVTREDGTELLCLYDFYEAEEAGTLLDPNEQYDLMIPGPYISIGEKVVVKITLQYYFPP